MSYMYQFFDCCPNNGDCGDATEVKQDQIIAAIAALQADVDDVQTSVDVIEDKVCKPKLC